MTISRNNIIWLVILASGITLVSLSFISNKGGDGISVVTSSKPSETPQGATLIPSLSPTPRKVPNVAKIPLPIGDGKTTFIDEPVPWDLLLSDASCELKGEIKFLNGNTYDNQDAVFIYSGIDHPARNIKWTVTPNDGSLSIGPNIFSKIQIPYGQVLLGIFPLQESKSKRYELTAKIEYGRLVDKDGRFVIAGGNVKLFEKQCQGKTTVVFP